MTPRQQPLPRKETLRQTLRTRPKLKYLRSKPTIAWVPPSDPVACALTSAVASARMPSPAAWSMAKSPPSVSPIATPARITLSSPAHRLASMKAAKLQSKTPHSKSRKALRSRSATGVTDPHLREDKAMPGQTYPTSLLDLIRNTPQPGGLTPTGDSMNAFLMGQAAQSAGFDPNEAWRAAADPQRMSQDMQQQVLQRGMPTGTITGAPGSLTHPNSWFLSRGDLESPLNYMASTGNSPFVPGKWQPNDQGGYFTLNQLYQGRNDMPSIFQHGSNMPSTNNWRLTLPYGGGPGAILRNGQLTCPGVMASRGHMASPSGTGMGPAEEPGSALPTNVEPGAALSGRNVWGAYYWPGGSPWGYTRWPMSER